MVIELILVAIIGILAGGLVNALADDLPYRRRVGLPTYPDGTPRPLTAWLGTTAFLFNARTPKTPDEAIPDEQKRKRYYTSEPKLSWRYPLTEIGTAFLMVLTLLVSRDHADMTTIQLIFWLVYMAIFMLIIVIDIEHKLILHVVTVPTMGLAIADALLVPQPQPNIQSALAGAVVGFVVFFVLYQGGFLFTHIMGSMRGEKINTVAFGFGDVMMSTVTGFVLGFQLVILSMFITVFLGALGAFTYLIIRQLLSGRYNLFTAIPYGPYIVIATIICLLFSDQVRMALLGY